MEICARCSTSFQVSEGNVYSIAVIGKVASEEHVDFSELSLAEIASEKLAVLDQLDTISSIEAEDDVYFEQRFFLCLRCFREWREAPAGIWGRSV